MDTRRVVATPYPRLFLRWGVDPWDVVKGFVAAAVAVPAMVVLLVGGAMSSVLAPPPSGALSPAAPGSPVGPSGVARPFTGVSVGCSVPDPTGTGGCVSPAMAWLLTESTAAFGPLPTSCWDEHAWNPSSDHPRGKGCDTTFGVLGRRPGPADEARGWAYAEWLRANAQPLHVSYVIWAGRIWSAVRADEGWRPYRGGGVYDPADATGGHYDHVHVSTSQ